MTRDELIEELKQLPADTVVVLDERNSRGIGYLWDIMAVFAPDDDNKHATISAPSIHQCGEACDHPADEEAEVEDDLEVEMHGLYFPGDEEALNAAIDKHQQRNGQDD